MSSTRRFSILGQLVALSIDDGKPPWRDRLDQLLAGFAAIAQRSSRADAPLALHVRRHSPGTYWEIEDGVVSVLAKNDNALLREVERRVFEAVAHHATLSLLLHAGAVARAGVALLLPAASGSGKTSLTLALAAQEWRPLTDDICPLELADDQWFAQPFPRCLHVNVRMVRLLSALGILLEGPVADLAGYYRPLRWGARAAVRAIAVPHYEVWAAPRYERLTQAEGLAELISASFARVCGSRAEERIAARHLAARVPAFRLTYSSVEEALRLVDEVIDQVMGASSHAASGPPTGIVGLPA